MTATQIENKYIYTFCCCCVKVICRSRRRTRRFPVSVSCSTTFNEMIVIGILMGDNLAFVMN